VRGVIERINLEQAGRDVIAVAMRTSRRRSGLRSATSRKRTGLRHRQLLGDAARPLRKPWKSSWRLPMVNQQP